VSDATSTIHERKGPTFGSIESRCYFWYEPMTLHWFIEAHAGDELCQTMKSLSRPTDEELDSIMYMLASHAAWKEHNDDAQ